MKQQAVNPFLPSWEHVPDGESHVFGDQLHLREQGWLGVRLPMTYTNPLYFCNTGKGAIDLRDLSFE